MSIPFGVGAVFAYGRLSEDIYSDLANPETLRMIGVSDLVASPDLTALFPGQQGAAIDVFLGDGRKLSMVEVKAVSGAAKSAPGAPAARQPSSAEIKKAQEEAEKAALAISAPVKRSRKKKTRADKLTLDLL